MYLMSRLVVVRNLVMLAPVLLSLLPKAAVAQTWVANRQGPSLSEILTVDQTGEQNWLWGAEDVAGNGQNEFAVSEQEIDARTAYVATSNTRFYSRVYFSVATAQPGNVSTFVFIDADQNPATGGHASATEFSSSFTTDPSNGGYEYVIRVQRTGNDATSGSYFRYSAIDQQFLEVTPQDGQLTTETNVFDDPIRVNQLRHGYVQSSVELSLIGLTQACDANIYVRTTAQAPTLGAGDLELGQVGHSCVPAVDTTTNVPVVITPPSGCTSNDECANGGVCANGVCIFTQPCAVNGDCAAAEACQQGRCVFVGGTACANSSTCNGLLCENRRCVVCTSNAACGAGFLCGPDGRCIAGTTPIQCANSNTCNGLLCVNGQCVACTNNASCGTGLVCDTNGRCLAPAGADLASDAGQIYVAPGERLQGGACACSAALGRGPRWLGFLGIAVAGALLGRSVKRERKR